MLLPSRPVWLLIGVHTLCLGIGYWFFYQLLVSTTEHQLTEDAWKNLLVRSAALGKVTETAKVSDLTSVSAGQAPMPSIFQQIPQSDQIGAVLVGADWNVLSPVSANSSDDWRQGEHVSWRSERQQISDRDPLRGRLTTPQGIRWAVGYPTADARACLVVYDARAIDSSWRASLLAILPIAGGIAFVWTWVLSSAATYLLSARRDSEETHRQAQSEHDALRSAQDLLRTRDAVIFGLAKLAESRDPETGHHLERISLYSTRLANSLRTHPKYRHIVTPGFVRLLGISSVLHDIGKVGLEDTVLLKPGPLTTEERKKMQEHTLVAGACLKEIEQRLGASNFLQTAREIALHHHERWDGTGYPEGMAGEEIPLAARIVTIADVYDALSSKRVYKDAFSHAECVKLIKQGAGTQFDPELVQVFLSIESDFAAITQRFAILNQAEAERTAKTDSGVMTSAQENVLRGVVSDSKSSIETTGRSTSLA